MAPNLAVDISDSIQIQQEQNELMKAAKNNRLHQLPHELLEMIVDCLASDDISNLSKAMIDPGAWYLYNLDTWFMSKRVSRTREDLNRHLASAELRFS